MLALKLSNVVVFILLINVKMPTIACILSFMSILTSVGLYLQLVFDCAHHNSLYGFLKLCLFSMVSLELVFLIVSLR